jgi:hypothetical protein
VEREKIVSFYIPMGQMRQPHQGVRIGQYEIQAFDKLSLLFSGRGCVLSGGAHGDPNGK